MKCLILILVVLAVSCSSSSMFNNVTPKYLSMANVSETDQKVYEKYIDLDKHLKKMVGDILKMALPYVMEANAHLNVSSSCTRDLYQLVSGIRQLKLSPFRFLDALGKLPAGVMTGNLYMIGDYDECRTTSVFRKDGNIDFKGQYCLVRLKPLLPKKKGRITIKSDLKEMMQYTKNTSEVMQFIVSFVKLFYAHSASFGLCVPAGCSSQDVSEMMNYFMENSYLNATVDYCEQTNGTGFTTESIIAIVVFSIVGLLNVVGSLMDYYSRKKGITFQSKCGRILLCFSILINFPKLISTKTSDVSLRSIHGIRALTMFYIVLVHQHMLAYKVPIFAHGVAGLNEVPTFFMQIILNGVLCVDVFFFLGGFLSAYIRIKVGKSSTSKLNVIKMIIHRLMRIYPIYVFSIFFTFLMNIANGPLSLHVKKEYLGNCEKYWWQNLLFINIFFTLSDTCLPQSWYIASDMHLFLMSLLTVPLFFWNPRKSIVIHLGIIFSGISGTVLWAWRKQITPSLVLYILDNSEMDKYMNGYTTTICHIAPYYIGLIVGYFLSKQTVLKISKVWQFIGWSVATLCFISMLFLTIIWNSGKEYTVAESSLYFAFSKVLYILSIAWLIVCCLKGYGGIINYILSLRIWVPIARLSYTVYLISPILQIFYFGHSKILMDFDKMSLIWRYMGDLTISHLCALAMVVVIESPIISLEKCLFHRQSNTKIENCEVNMDVRPDQISGENCLRDVEFLKCTENDVGRISNVNGVICYISGEKNDKSTNDEEFSKVKHTETNIKGIFDNVQLTQ